MKDLVKFIIIITCLVCCSTIRLANAETNVSGVIVSNTTWTKAGSPYIVTGNIVVDTLVTLTIQPGVTVKLDPQKAIRVTGNLYANGTVGDSIVFTKNGTAGWTKLWFKSSSKCSLSYCRIEYADNFVAGANNAAIFSENSDSVYIGYCTISNNTGEGGIILNNVQGAVITKKSAIITHSTITHNSCITNDGGCGGIAITGGPATITNNTIAYNSSGHGAGIFIHDARDKISITNNSIVYNTAAGSAGGGIYCSYTSPSTDTTFYLTNNMISCNSVGWAGGGIYYEGRSTGGSVFSKIAYNTINNNTAGSKTFPAGLGGGIYIGGGGFLQTFGSIAHNTIANNTAIGGGGAIYSSGLSAIRYNTIRDTNSSAIFSFGSSNSIGAGNFLIRTNNIYATGYATAVDNSIENTQDIDAKYNYWNSVNVDTINAKTFDYFDDFSKGRLLFKPFLKAPFSDSIAPAAPLYPTAVRIADSTFIITWTNPAEPGGIAECHYKTGEAPNADFDISGILHNAPDTVISSDGELFLWLVDSSGNLDYRNSVSVPLVNSRVLRQVIPAELRPFQQFTDRIVIHYELSQKSTVSLGLFTASGKEVKSVFSGTRGKGSYTETIQKTGLSGGVFYIRLKAGNGSLSRRITVVK